MGARICSAVEVDPHIPSSSLTSGALVFSGTEFVYTVVTFGPVYSSKGLLRLSEGTITLYRYVDIEDEVASLFVGSRGGLYLSAWTNSPRGAGQIALL